MFDPRDDTRDRGEDGRERAYEGRDHTGDPRDVFLHDVDLPLEREREYVLDRDHVYELNGDDARTLATVGAFRVVPERELLDGDDALGVSDSLDHLREQGLIETVPIGDHDQGILLVVLEEALKREYQEFLQAHNRTGQTATVARIALTTRSSAGRGITTCRSSTSRSISPTSASSTRWTVASAMRTSRC